MAISTVTSRVAYSGDGSSAVFSFPYRIDSQSHLAVFTFNSSAPSVAGMVSGQVLNTHYTISGTADALGIYRSGVNVTFNSSPNAQTNIILFRSSVINSAFSVPQNGSIPATSLTNELDYLTMLQQRAQDLETRSMRLPDGFFSSTFDPTLPPNLQQGAGWALIVNSSATGFAITPVGSTLFSGILPIQYGGTGTNSSFALGNVLYAGSGGIYTTNNALNWNVASSFLTVSANSTAIGAPLGTIFRVTGQNDSFARMVTDSHSSSALSHGAAHISRRSSGTAAAPLAVAGDMNLGYFGAGGYGTTNFGAPLAGMLIRAAQNFTDANQGTYLSFLTVANSTVIQSEQFRVDQDGTPYFRKLGPTGALQAGSGGVITAGLLSVTNGGTGTGTSYIQYGVIFASSATQLASAPSATAGFVLVSNGSSAPSFQSVSATTTVVPVSANYNVGASDGVLILNSSNFQVNLPGIVPSYREVTLQKSGPELASVTIAGSGVAAVINVEGTGFPNIKLWSQGESVTLGSYGSSWLVKQWYIPQGRMSYVPSALAANQGGGSSTGVSYYYTRQSRSSLLIQGYELFGTQQGLEMRRALPGGLTTASSYVSVGAAAEGSSHFVGMCSYDIVLAGHATVLAQRLKGYLNFGVSSGTRDPLAAVTDTTLAGTGKQISFSAQVLVNEFLP